MISVISDCVLATVRILGWISWLLMPPPLYVPFSLWFRRLDLGPGTMELAADSVWNLRRYV
jgi:hypothetical protein